MVSEAKLEANRQNALRSTGPKTPRGKARSSLNALTHGLTAKHFVAKGESVAEFERLAQGVLAQFPPRNEIEKHQVHRLIELLWKAKRARLFETAVLSTPPPPYKPFMDAFESPQHECHTDLPLPEKYRRALLFSDIFELAEKVDAYAARIWREIRKLVEDLTLNRVLEPEIVTIEAQSDPQHLNDTD